MSAAAIGRSVAQADLQRIRKIIPVKELYLDGRFQQGIGGSLVQALIKEAGRAGRVVTLGVVKINPARRLYARLGFRTTHEDQYKFYKRREPDRISHDRPTP